MCIRPYGMEWDKPQTPREGAEGTREDQTLAAHGQRYEGTPCGPARALLAFEGLLPLERA